MKSQSLIYFLSHRLFFRGREILDDGTVHSCGLTEDSTILLVQQQPKEKNSSKSTNNHDSNDSQNNDDHNDSNNNSNENKNSITLEQRNAEDNQVTPSVLFQNTRFMGYFPGTGIG